MKEVDLNELSAEIMETLFDESDIEQSKNIKSTKDNISLKHPTGVTNEMLLNEIHNGINVKQNRELLIRYNYPLAVSIAKRCKCYIPEEDKISYAVEGLLNSIHNFDVTKGVLFSTYASASIYMTVMNMSNEHNNLVYIPRHVSVHNVNIRKFANEYEKKHGKKCKPELISKELGINVDTVELCLSFHETTSLDTPTSDDSTALIDTIASDCNVEQNDVDSIVLELMNELEPKEKEILSRIYGLNGYAPETYDSLISTGFYDKNGKRITVRGTLHYKFSTALEKLKRLVRLKGLTAKDV